MLKRAYELSQSGDFLGAAKECESEYLRDQSLVSAVEGVDFYVLAAAPQEALRFAELVRLRIDGFRARVEFFRSLALWDAGDQVEARETYREAIRLGYRNRERMWMEWTKRVDEATFAAMKSEMPGPDDSRHSESSDKE